MRAWCDARLTGTIQPYNGNQYPDPPGIGAGYEGESYAPAVVNFALLYQLTKEAKYGQRAVAIMLVMSGSGAASPSVDSGYIIRNYGLAYGLGYDWCHELMTPAQRTQIYTNANAHIAYWEAGKAFESEPTAGNYYAGYFCAKALCALATYDENPSAPAQWADWHDQMFPAMRDYFAKHLAGGGWPEGFGYGPLAISNIVMPLWAVKTATGEDVESAMPFASDCAKYVMHAAWPGAQYIDDRDLLHSGGVPNAMNAGLLALLACKVDASLAPAFRSFRKEVGGSIDPAWRAVLYADPISDTAPLDTLPLSYFAPGMGQMFARSGWDDAATWVSYRGAAYAGYPDAAEQFFDQGSPAIVNGKTPFLLNTWGAMMRDPGGDADESRGMNAGVQQQDLAIWNTFVTDKGGQTSNTGATTQTTMLDAGNYVYAKTTGLEQAYRAGVTKWQRELVYLRPGIVIVFDQTADNAGDRWMQWHLNPNGGGKMTVAWPADAVQTSAPLFAASKPAKVTQIKVRSASNGGRWLTVFDTNATSLSVKGLDDHTVQVGDQTVSFGTDGVTVNGVAPAPAPAPAPDPSPSPAPAPAPVPAPPPPSQSMPTITRKGRWVVAGGGAHNTPEEAFEDALSLALVSLGQTVTVTPPSFDVVAK